MTNELMKRLSELPNVTMDDGQEYIQLYDAMETVKRALEQEQKYCDRNICMANEYNGIGCDECEVQEPTDENLHREREQAYMLGYEDASKRFRQEPCEDAISRQAVLDLCDKSTKYDIPFEYYEGKKHIRGWDMGRIINMTKLMQLPSVKPQPKTGHWILADEQNKEDVENDNYRFICSECQCSDIHAKGTIVPYCWKCGCRMVDEQERSK